MIREGTAKLDRKLTSESCNPQWGRCMTLFEAYEFPSLRATPEFKLTQKRYEAAKHAREAIYAKFEAELARHIDSLLDKLHLGSHAEALAAIEKFVSEPIRVPLSELMAARRLADKINEVTEVAE